jgi:hypothetical protein
MAWNIRTSRTMTPDLEILVNQVNVDVAASVVIDATSVAPDGNGDRTLVAGTPLRKDTVTKQYKRWVTADGTTDPIRGILAHTVRLPDGTAQSDVPAAMWAHGQWFRSDRIVGWATDQAAIKAALPTCKFT